MTSIARAPSLDVLLALCCVCGTTRTVSRRAIGSDGNRPLRCETCRKTTPHAAIGAEGRLDYGEEQNRKTRPNLTVADQLDVLRALDVDVQEVDTLERRDGTRTTVTLWWMLDDDVFDLEFNRQATEAELGRALAKALERVTRPRDHKWYVQAGADGRPVADVVLGVVDNLAGGSGA